MVTNQGKCRKTSIVSMLSKTLGLRVVILSLSGSRRIMRFYRIFELRDLAICSKKEEIRLRNLLTEIHLYTGFITGWQTFSVDILT